MTSPFPAHAKIAIRPMQYRDLEAIASGSLPSGGEGQSLVGVPLKQPLEQARRWYGLFKFLSWFPNPLQHHFRVYVAESERTGGESPQLLGFVQIAPFNKSRSTWRVGQVSALPGRPDGTADFNLIGSQLLRYCFEKVWEARTWILEVNVNEKDALALYRQNGFQPLAQMTYWSLSPELLHPLADRDPDLPNLLPASNADAQLLYQLDCVSMPPLLRQVFDRHVQDFKTSLGLKLLAKLQQWCSRTGVAKGYVFETQRKAAIGYFTLNFSQDGSHPHQARLTVHPAYTWLYPKFLAQMAQMVKSLPPQPLELVSADYQHEREEYLERVGAERIRHTLLMSRSVWHKLREVKREGLQLSEVLQGLQPVPRTPIPSRLSWLEPSRESPRPTLDPQEQGGGPSEFQGPDPSKPSTGDR